MSVMANSRRILITGSRGFIGTHLTDRLDQEAGWEILEFTRDNAMEELGSLVAQADAVCHLAGVNRPRDPKEFIRVNKGLTQNLCEAIIASGRAIPLLLASSIHVGRNTYYGRSKQAAESVVATLAESTGNPVVVFRLPGVFGRGCRPNYNSVVATFCHQIARDWPIRMDDPDTVIRLVHIGSVVSAFVQELSQSEKGVRLMRVLPEYAVSLETLANHIRAFRRDQTAVPDNADERAWLRVLHDTYLSYQPLFKDD